MTYSLNTLNASSAAKSPPRTGAARFGHEIGLVVGLLALVFWLLALGTFFGIRPLLIWLTHRLGDAPPRASKGRKPAPRPTTGHRAPANRW